VRPGRDICESRLATTTHRHAAPTAWNDLVGRFAPYVAAVAGAYRLPDAEAEELFQDVFTHAWTRVGTLSDDDLMRDWIVALTDELATRRRQSLDTGTAPPPELLDELHRLLLVGEAIRQLPEAQREIARRHVEGEEEDAIAEALGMEPEVVAEQVRRVRRRLRARVGPLRRNGSLRANND
jgi:RNA polymerase sigma factor (sigma-70 family)